MKGRVREIDDRLAGFQGKQRTGMHGCEDDIALFDNAHVQLPGRDPGFPHKALAQSPLQRWDKPFNLFDSL